MTKSLLERTKQVWEEKRLPYRLKHQWGELGVLPNCLIVGAQKAGTTSLYEHLIRHPDVWPPDCREINFFNDKWLEGENWYRARFPNKLIKFWSLNIANRPFVTLESTPVYFIDKNTPSRVAELIPNCKLIFLLRNPIDRAYSHWRMNVRRKFEELSFEEALAKEEERIAPDIEKAQESSFLATNDCNLALYYYKYRGLYLERLQPWFNIFPKEQIKIIKSEDMWKDASKYHETFKFLGLLKDKQQVEKFQKFYGTSSKMSSNIDQKIRDTLREYFREPNQSLYHFLGQNFEWN